MTLKAWNNLPQSIRSADSLDSYKRKLKFYLFNSSFNVELFMYVYSGNALPAQFFAVGRALNSFFMIMIMIISETEGSLSILPLMPIYVS